MTRRALKSLGLPALVSVAIHAGALALIATVTWTVATHERRPARQPVAVTLAAPATTPTPAPQTTAPATSRAAPAPAPPSADTTPPPTAPVARSGAPRAVAPLPESPSVSTLRAPVRSATFAGVRAKRARTVVFVIDASGPMATALPYVVDELLRSLSQLAPDQRFTVVAFRDRSALNPDDPSTTSSFSGTLVNADEQTVARAERWLHALAPTGRSNPLDGLRAALALQPDVVFLLAHSIERSGPEANWGGGRDVILAELDRLNPRDTRSGARRTVIKTVQFLRPDPSGTLFAIAEAHADATGPSAPILTTEDLLDKLGRPPPPAPLGTDALSNAAGTLEQLSRTGADLVVLAGVPTPDETRAVSDAASEALRSLNDARLLAISPEDAESREPLLRARALLLLAGADADPAAARRAADLLTPLEPDEPDAQRFRDATLASAAILSGDTRTARSLAPTVAGADALALEALAVELATSPPAEQDTLLDRASRTFTDPAFAPLLAEIGARALAQSDEPARLALACDLLLALRGRDDLTFDADAYAMHKLELLTEPDWPYEQLPPEAALVQARVQSQRARTERAVELYELAARDPDLAPIALRESAATLAVSPESSHRTAEIESLIDLVEHDAPGSSQALERALALAYEHAPGSDLYRRALDTARARSFDLPHADFWRTEWARRADPADALSVLEEIAPDSDWHAQAATLTFDLYDTLLASAGTSDRVALTRRRAAYARTHAPDRFDDDQAALARALVANDPGESLALATSLLDRPSRVAGGAPRLRLIIADAQLAGGDDAAAFETLRSLVDELESSGATRALYFDAWARLLELSARTDDGARTPELRTHILRLRSIDPDLGTPDAEARINAIERSLR